MDVMVLKALAIVVIFIAIVGRLWRSEGWARFPGFDENGKFQVNVIGIIITGVIGALPILDTLNFDAATTLYLQLALLGTVFTGVYGTPASLDFIGTFLNQKLGNKQTDEEQESVTGDSTSNNEALVEGEGEGEA